MDEPGPATSFDGHKLEVGYHVSVTSGDFRGLSGGIESVSNTWGGGCALVNFRRKGKWTISATQLRVT